MDYYIDIEIRGIVHQALSSLYSELHTQLRGGVGISFPRAKVVLGNLLRLHGGEAELKKITVTTKGCISKGVKKVPSNCKHQAVRRIQPKFSQSKIRRLAKRGNWGDAEIRECKINMLRSGIDDPFIELRSVTNGKLYRRFFQFEPITNTPVKGEFDSFGLSKSATLPWF